MTSLMNALDSINREKPPLRQRVQEGLAKLEALEAIQVNQRMNRDAARLHQKALATYKKLGMEVKDDDEEGDGMRDQIVLGDQIQIGDAAVKSLDEVKDDSGGQGTQQDAGNPTAGEGEGKNSQGSGEAGTTSAKPSLASRLGPAAVIGASIIGGSGLVGYGLTRSGDTTVTHPSAADTNTQSLLKPDDAPAVPPPSPV